MSDILHQSQATWRMTVLPFRNFKIKNACTRLEDCHFSFYFEDKITDTALAHLTQESCWWSLARASVCVCARVYTWCVLIGHFTEMLPYVFRHHRTSYPDCPGGGAEKHGGPGSIDRPAHKQPDCRPVARLTAWLASEARQRWASEGVCLAQSLVRLFCHC